MGRKLYVGNLPYSVTEEKLEEMFSGAGRVESVKIIINRDTGQSKGFAFVEMSNDSEANAAISKLNGTDLDGRPMKISEARPQTDRGGGGGGRGRGGYGGGGGGGGRGGYGGDGNRW